LHSYICHELIGIIYTITISADDLAATRCSSYLHFVNDSGAL